MSRFLVFSDVHAHPFPYGSSFVKWPPFKGLHNSRLVDTIRAIADMGDYAHLNGIKTVLFTGDLFHTRTSVKTVARNLVTHIIKERFVDRGINLVMIPGNHDYADRVGHIHSLQPLQHLGKTVTVLDSVTSVDVEDLTVITVPYTDSIKKARKDLEAAAELADAVAPGKLSVLLAHLGVQGAKVGSDYVLMCPSDVGGGDIPFSRFNLCFFGHYHQHQSLAVNAWFTGALTQQNWSDVNGARGFIDVGYDSTSTTLVGAQSVHEVSGKKIHSGPCKDLPIARVESGAPVFIVADKHTDLSVARACDFVMYKTDVVLSDTEQKQLRSSCKAAEFDIKPIKQQGNGKSIILDSTQLNAETSLEPWVLANAPDDLDQNELLKLGEELLAVGQGNAFH